MDMKYQKISRSWVAQHPEPKGAIQLYGGEVVGLDPINAYDYFLQCLFGAGYTVIAVPVQFGLDHEKIAYSLLEERDIVRHLLPELDGLPHFWIGHSVGCKMITLLEVFTTPSEGPEGSVFLAASGRSFGIQRRGILNEPTVLMAPDFSDTSDAIRVPILPGILDQLGLGVQPTRAETRKLVQEDDLFHVTAVISFQNDTVAGNEHSSPETSTVAWLIHTLKQRHGDNFVHHEIAGAHLEPVGVEFDNTRLIGPNLRGIVRIEHVPRALEPLVINVLQTLETRIVSQHV